MHLLQGLENQRTGKSIDAAHSSDAGIPVLTACWRNAADIAPAETWQDLTFQFQSNSGQHLERERERDVLGPVHSIPMMHQRRVPGRTRKWLIGSEE